MQQLIIILADVAQFHYILLQISNNIHAGVKIRLSHFYASFLPYPGKNVISLLSSIPCSFAICSLQKDFAKCVCHTEPLLDSSPGEKFFIYILHLFSKKIIEKSGNF
jgi:hypothetical protein